MSNLRRFVARFQMISTTQEFILEAKDETDAFETVTAKLSLDPETIRDLYIDHEAITVYSLDEIKEEI
jgi:hypothetical protein